MTVSLSPFPCVSDSDAIMVGSSSHATMNCMTSSSTSYDKPSPQTVDAANPSSARAAADLRRGYFKGGVFLKQEVTSSSGAYGRSQSKIGSCTCGASRSVPRRPYRIASEGGWPKTKPGLGVFYLITSQGAVGGFTTSLVTSFGLLPKE